MFCECNYGVMFLMFVKIDVKGDYVYLLYCYLIDVVFGIFGFKVIKWNFMKFLIDCEGWIVKCYVLFIKFDEIVVDIDKLL